MARASSWPGSQSRISGTGMSDFPGEPADRPGEEGAVAVPADELVRAPVGRDVGGPGERTAGPGLPYGQQGVAGNGREQRRVLGQREAVVAEQVGPLG